MEKNILIRMPNWLGDAVMGTPVIEDVRKNWPEANITVMCQGSVHSLLLGNPHIDEIFSFSRPNEFLRREERRNIIARLQQGKYDLGILLPNSFSSAWWLWRGDVKRRIGFRNDFRSFLLTDPLPFPKERGKEHLVNTYKRHLSPLGIPLSNTDPALYVTEKERKAISTLFSQYEIPLDAKIVGINPGAAYGTAKCWLPERFHEVTKKLLADPTVYVLYFGDATGSSLVESICDELPPSRVFNLAGKTNLRELLALIQRCNAFLTNDSGPMHIAAALKTPLVALFGSTNDVATGPYKHGVVIHKHVECSPCYKRVCPIDFRCMKRIESDEVYETLKKLL
ncbi:MAG: ADP-heptose--LPS heptosyltransferase 2 [Chlamydiae bacterium]|nr:ADP-heptose--LPS heptosyltransferase 2 [Chlamydiota bacterium]